MNRRRAISRLDGQVANCAFFAPSISTGRVASNASTPQVSRQVVLDGGLDAALLNAPLLHDKAVARPLPNLRARGSLKLVIVQADIAVPIDDVDVAAAHVDESPLLHGQPIA